MTGWQLKEYTLPGLTVKLNFRKAANSSVLWKADAPLAAADIIGFTLQHELSYTNIFNMLRMAEVPLLAAERHDTWPLVLGGGPCAYNPEPLADFFDAFLIGDGEEAAPEIAKLCRELKKSGAKKSELLERLATIPGVYVPSFFSVEYLEDGRVDRIVALKDGYT